MLYCVPFALRVLKSFKNFTYERLLRVINSDHWVDVEEGEEEEEEEGVLARARRCTDGVRTSARQGRGDASVTRKHA